MPRRRKTAAQIHEDKVKAGKAGAKAVLEKYGPEHMKWMGQQRAKQMISQDPNSVKGCELWVPGRFREWFWNMVNNQEPSEAKSYFSRQAALMDRKLHTREQRREERLGSF